MSKGAQMWGSIGILSTMGTFIILGVLGWSGVGTLKAYSTAVEVDFVRGQMTTMNQTLTEVLVLQHERNSQVDLHSLRLEYCEKNQIKCMEFINAK